MAPQGLYNGSAPGYAGDTKFIVKTQFVICMCERGGAIFLKLSNHMQIYTICDVCVCVREGGNHLSKLIKSYAKYTQPLGNSKIIKFSYSSIEHRHI